MAEAGLSLDDIIEKSKRSGMRGRSGIRKSVNRGARINSSVRGHGLRAITDARFKIIQKNREKLTDARDKLAEIAKQSDARLKLDKLRASQLQKIDLSLSGISHKSGWNERISLATSKIPAAIPRIPSTSYRTGNAQTTGYRSVVEPHYVDNTNIDFNKDYLAESVPLRQTVINQYAQALSPPPPMFNVKSSSSYTWVKPTSSTVVRSALSRNADVDRSRNFKIVARPSTTKLNSSPFREEWAFGSKSRTILTDDNVDDKYFDARIHRDVGVKSRLDSIPSKPRTIGILSRPKMTSSSALQSTGYRIVVSNLQANVTQEDIKELFEDVGELLVSRLVRPGTAEVIYKTLKDATKAVETYHNRQLDGHPMKCLLVNPRPKNNPTGPAVGPLVVTRRNASSSYVQPSLEAVHRALFDG